MSRLLLLCALLAFLGGLLAALSVAFANPIAWLCAGLALWVASLLLPALEASR